MNSELFKSYLLENEVKIFQKLQTILKQLNYFSNLTKLIDNEDYWIMQVYDSIWPFFKNSQKVFDNQRFIDIGSGCGFPGIAYAIIHPHSEVYLVDSSKKKTNALKEIVNKLNLPNKIYVIHNRIENIAHKPEYRNKFDLGTTRAVSIPSTVAEYLIPILNSEGKGLLYCGRWEAKDKKNLQTSLSKLNGSIIDIQRRSLPNLRGERHAIFIGKLGNCPEIYPRGNGKPKKYPL